MSPARLDGATLRIVLAKWAELRDSDKGSIQIVVAFDAWLQEQAAPNRGQTPVAVE